MPGGYKNIKHEDGKAWKKGQSGNPNGPRVKVFSAIAKEYRERGIEKATPDVVAEAYEYLLALSISEILEMAGNPKIENDMPSLLRLMAKDMMGKQGLLAIKEMLDRAHGKSTNRHEVGGKGGSPIRLDFSKLSNDELREMSKMRKKATSNGDSERSPSNGK